MTAAGGFRRELDALLARFDDEGYVALANRGLLRRAQKDLERTAVALAEEAQDNLVVTVGEHRIRFDARGPAGAQCSCPASGVCQHILAAAIGLQRLAATQPEALEKSRQGEVTDPLAPLREALLKLSAADLVGHAGKASYRWAWQFVHDLDAQDAVTFGGEQHLVIGFARPRVTLRYMGGGVEALIADTELRQVEKYRVAAVLAFQRAHGVEPTAPEPTRAAARSGALDLGQDHRLEASASESVELSRQRLRDSTQRLLAEAVELGLAHLSPGVQERFATLAVWAQGAEYYRLALLLRRVADHVEMLLERAGGADEHRLLDELTLAFAIVAALDDAATRGLAPAHLVGQSRTRYEASSTLELWGLGASPWRSASGYQGLTMLFWSPADGAFFSCTDARPQTMRGFDPRARYKAAGPWSGLGAPALATGRRVVLSSAQLNAGGRLSAAESTSAVLLPEDQPGAWARQLKPWTSWAALSQARGAVRRSLLAEARPMHDWVFLQPAAFGRAEFDEARQTLCWLLLDASGEVLMAELGFNNFTAPALQRLEGHAVGANEPGTLVVARVRPGSDPLVVEPLSLLAGGRTTTRTRLVDALYFDEAEQQPLASRLRRMLMSGRGAPEAAKLAECRSPAVLRQLRDELQRLGERGVADDGRLPHATRLHDLQRRAAEQGLDVLAKVIASDCRAGEGILRLNFVRLQCETLFGAAAETLG